MEIQGQISLFGKMSPEPLAPIKGKILESSSKNSQKSQTPKLLFLDLRKGSGLKREASWEMVGALPGVQWTLNIGECPSAAVASTLSQILEASVPEKYFLSAKACEGILRRADRRGKQLPPMLEEALRQQIERAS